MARSSDVKTPKCRLAFTQGLFELQDNNGRKQWNVSLLFPKGSDISVLENAALEAAVAEWGDKAKKMIADKLIKSPFLDGDGPQGKSKKTGEPHKGFPGHTFIRANSGADYRPKLVNAKVLPITEKSECPSGSWGYAVVSAYTWDNTEQGKGISFNVGMVQVAKVAEGEEVLGGSGGGNPDDHFEKLEDEGDAPAATKTGEGAAGLFG